MSPPLLSIVVCTHNRSSDVLECLRSLHAQVDLARTDIVLVDSASSPEDRRTMESGLADLPGIQRIRLDAPGLSIARNAGVAASKGQWVAFVDDDAVPWPDWHARLLEVLASIPDDCGAIGGRIVAIFPDGASPEIGPRWQMYVSINDRIGSRDCTDRFELIGANCCFRRTAFDQAGGFPTDLGRFKGSLLSGEDVMLMNRLRSLGWRIRFESAFCVGHKVSQERLTRRWVRSRAYWEGITTVRMASLLRDRGRFRLLLKTAFATPVVGVLSLVAIPSGEWDLRFWFDYGIISESLRISRKAL